MKKLGNKAQNFHVPCYKRGLGLKGAWYECSDRTEMRWRCNVTPPSLPPSQPWGETRRVTSQCHNWPGPRPPRTFLSASSLYRPDPWADNTSGWNHITNIALESGGFTKYFFQQYEHWKLALVLSLFLYWRYWQLSGQDRLKGAPELEKTKEQNVWLQQDSGQWVLSGKCPGAQIWRLNTEACLVVTIFF